MVLTIEGYSQGLSSSTYSYYRRDHLGNNREAWQAPPSEPVPIYREGGGAGFTSQRTQYYPSGLPWAEGEGASVQNKKYNGKEWIEAHGLDEYDYGARGYYAAIGRFNTVDPLSESKPWMTPYMYCSGNPVNRIDPDGMDDFFKNNGQYSYTINNGTHNIYVISYNKTNILLSNYSFGKHNAKYLASIGKYYATQQQLDMKKLPNGDLSVANRTYELGSPISESLHNGGSISSGEDMMNRDRKTNAITFSLENGKINDLLNNTENLKSTLRHEFDHLKGLDEVKTLYNEIKNPLFKNTSDEYKSNIQTYIKDVIYQMSTYQDTNWTKTQINELHKQAELWKTQFMKYGVKF